MYPEKENFFFQIVIFVLEAIHNDPKRLIVLHDHDQIFSACRFALIKKPGLFGIT